MKPDDHSASKSRLRYGLLGTDDSTTEEKLSKFTGQVGWDFLRPHQRAGVLYFVDPALTLLQVGTAFAGNDAAAVEQWLKLAFLVKVEALHAAQWEGTDTIFDTLVVSPFVLCRPV